MGKLFIVPTPIGNLEDMTFRAIRVLKEVDAILAEDTRVTSKLLNHYDISNKLIAHHQNNEHKTIARLIEELKAGSTYALVTDAGTPAISDPGFLLTRACVENDIEVDCLPGATAFVPALVNSGFPCEKFNYIGFLPHKKGRETIVKIIAETERTTVLYESPHRLLKALKLFETFFEADRQISISREISKKFEETVRGNARELTEYFENKAPKGEFVMVVEGLKNKK
ncbi:16S rRNA (cytidine(1402)-2'-O)-methyltransferase [Putridiphycobacter roseus]|uniref:Ribosomal RNA small subunit methyltransferase I n=1 Tax=Putridiphycobacter roseus TaxID=2219161 RepID=A0A2W1NNT4_9FLAO|nr:16S rRNA (cytidine(1402)-2'-O)-methyltransferase [Putridiphycobacter roseus]PZE17302.1 16S rRNA (cytidine(1402)-2'-O)-methyltransferase [Putridiphycobacter roseus]